MTSLRRKYCFASVYLKSFYASFFLKFKQTEEANEGKSRMENH